jgi:hypothetical protein
MPVLVAPAKEAILGRNCNLEVALFGASQATIFSKRGSPRNLKRISSNRQSRGLARGCDAPNPLINQSSNLVPAVSAHTVASKTPFGA